MASPKILKMSWGSISVERIGDDGQPVEGEEVSYRDVKVWPGGSCAWDWKKTGRLRFNNAVSVFNSPSWRNM